MFEVTTVQGEKLNYRSVWQQRNLVLVALASTERDAEARFVSEITARLSEFQALESACAITREKVSGLPAPGALVADRWGEIAHAVSGASISDLPAVDDLLDWAAYLQQRCPECEGEAR